MSGYQHDTALDARIRQLGGVIDESQGDRVVTFPDDDQSPEAMAADAKEVEAAVERAKDFGTAVLPLWRERGDGWYVAESHDEHPGFMYVCQIDERTGRPIGCECIASHVCHHLGAAISHWRQRHDYEANGAAALAGWEETMERVRAEAPKVQQEEAWI